MKKLITPVKFVATFLQRFLCLILLLIYVSPLHFQNLINVSGLVKDVENDKQMAGAQLL